MGKKKGNSGLGKAIIRDRFGGKSNQKSGESFVSITWIHDTDSITWSWIHDHDTYSVGLQ